MARSVETALLAAAGELLAELLLVFLALEVGELLLGRAEGRRLRALGLGLLHAQREAPRLNGALLVLAPDDPPKHAADEGQQDHDDDPHHLRQVAHAIFRDSDDVDERRDKEREVERTDEEGHTSIIFRAGRGRIESSYSFRPRLHGAHPCPPSSSTLCPRPSCWTRRARQSPAPLLASVTASSRTCASASASS